ncbi:hypothetical protein EPN81_01030 [Patescibacteria group bacterium]|nr:MAG: hypothetical protein EPN81_01030 [Patescibacteria group bacterium]
MLKLFDQRWLAIVMLLTVAALPIRTQASTQTIVFSEIAWAGSSISSSDEWIELTNVSDAAIDISGWTLTGAGSSGASLVLPEASLMEPHSTYLIANYEHAHENTALAVQPNFVTATLSVSNEGFNLALYDNGNTLVDVAGGAGAPFAGGSGGTGDSLDGRYTSMVRTDGLNDGALPESWMDADSSQGFLEGVDDLGTPGIVTFATTEQIVLQEIDEEPAEEPAVEEIIEEVMEERTEESLTQTILINEFVVDPNEGEEEWIELVNTTDTAVDLTGWTIEDTVGKQTVLEGVIAPGEYLLITEPLGKLNNDTDEIILKDAAGANIDSVEYGTDELPAPEDGAALARNESGVFELTYETTPGSVNVIDQEKHEVVEEVEDVTQETVVVEEVLEEIAEEVEPETVEEEVHVPTVTNIHINEFVVDPAGDGVEWIELSNAGDTQVTLTGWSMEDASGNVTDLSSVTIEAYGYVLIESPKGNLNNDGDTVILKDADGSMVESVTYGDEGYPIPGDGESLARNGETFEVTQSPTPGTANLIVALDEIEEGEDVVETLEESDSVVVSVETTISDELSEESNESEAQESQVEEIVEEEELIKTLRFVTLYPNTTGSDETEEYIELQNTGTETIDLQGWTIEDESTNRYTIESSTLLAAGATIKLMREQTDITLNNDGDTLELIAPDGAVVDTVSYGTSQEGATYELVNTIWEWLGVATVVESTTASVSNSTQNNATTTTNATYASSTVSSRVAQSLTVAQAKEKADGQYVIVKGVITAAPDTFGSQIFYLQDETGGIQVYLYSRDFPDLLIGDAVYVRGEMSTSRGERRIKLSGSASVVPASGSFESGATDLSLEEVNEALVGMLMTVGGQIQSINTNKLVIETSGITLTIYLKSNPAIDPNQFERGDTIEVTGVLTTYDGELRLRPRSNDDIQVMQQAPVATATVSEQTNGESTAGLVLLFSTMAVLGALALWRYMPRRRLTQARV